MNSFDRWAEGVGRRQTLAKAETLFLRGDASRGPYILRAGQVRLYRQDETGSEVTLHRARPGEGFAEASVFSEVYHCDCVAEEQSTIIAIPKAAIQHALKNDPEFSSSFTESLARQVMHLRTGLELRNIRSAEQRVLAALRLRAGEKDQSFEIAGTLKAFAAEIGLTHEALYRALRKLEDGGTLGRDGRNFKIL